MDKSDQKWQKWQKICFKKFKLTKVGPKFDLNYQKLGPNSKRSYTNFKGIFLNSGTFRYKILWTVWQWVWFLDLVSDGLCSRRFGIGDFLEVTCKRRLLVFCWFCWFVRLVFWFEHYRRLSLLVLQQYKESLLSVKWHNFNICIPIAKGLTLYLLQQLRFPPNISQYKTLLSPNPRNLRLKGKSFVDWQNSAVIMAQSFYG